MGAALKQVRELDFRFQPIGWKQICPFIKFAQYNSLLLKEKKAQEDLQRQGAKQIIALVNMAKVLGEKLNIPADEALQKIQENVSLIALIIGDYSEEEIGNVLLSQNSIENARLTPLAIFFNSRSEVLAGYEKQRLETKKAAVEQQLDRQLKENRITPEMYSAGMATFAKNFGAQIEAASVDPATWIPGAAWEADDLLDFPEAVIVEIEEFLLEEATLGESSKKARPFPPPPETTSLSQPLNNTQNGFSKVTPIITTLSDTASKQEVLQN